MEKTIPSSDVMRHIRGLKLHTKRLLSAALVGDSRSAQKGVGFEFDQIREYQMGDDVRCIDWNASSRMGELLVKQYIEERNRTILIAVDVSASSYFGSSHVARQSVITQLAGMLALVAQYGKDLVGCILFSDEVELYIPPKKGGAHTQKILECLFSYRSSRPNTRCSAVFKHLLSIKKRNAQVFVLSDFIDEQIDQHLKHVSRVYDMVFIRYLDRHEMMLPAVGFLTMEDIETGKQLVIDTRNEQQVRQFLHKRILDQDVLFKKAGVELLTIHDPEQFVGTLISFLKKRMRY